MKIKTIEELNNSQSDYVATRIASKKVEVKEVATGETHEFTTVRQCVEFVQIEQARNTPVTVSIEEKQGSDAVKVDTAKLVLFSSQIRSPRPSTVKSPEATKQLRALGKKTDAMDAVVKMLAYTGSDGKDKNRPELVAVGTIRDEWKKFLDDRSLNISMNGQKVISVHHIAEVLQFAEEINDKLAKQASIIQAKLDDWKQEAIASGRYVDGKWPSKAYFEGYGIKTRVSRFDESMDYPDEIGEVREEAVGKLNEAINTTVTALNNFFGTGDKPARSFKDASIEQLYHCAETMREGGFVESEKFSELAEKISEFAKDFDADEVRKIHKRVSNGVKVAKPKEGRGRRAIPYTQDDLDADKKKLNEVCDPLKDIKQELEGLI